ncbi:MAG TPA: murein biosynthesis integral membrane protein MurJ, partial [Acidimicrobiales bacterium]|nr:murein biosynthesis integral membrane protein MurJ [Acidimicrobiales bacterium]
PPDRAGPGALYDQDHRVSPPPVRGRSAPWRQQALDRQRDREIELRRQQDWEREREIRRQRARDAQVPSPAQEPVRISSRPLPVPVGRRPITSGETPGATPARPPAAGGSAVKHPSRAAARPAGPTGRHRPAGPPRGDGPARGASTGRATAVLAAGTFASRVTGFLRVLAIAYVLGVGTLSDAYNYANGIPNIVYDLLLGGVLSATLIPVFVEQFNTPQNGDEDGRNAQRAVNAVMSSITVALAVMSLLLWLLAPWVIRFYLILNPASTGPAERAVATRLLHFFAPQVFFLGAIVVSTALLNTRRRFAAAAVSPVVNNLVAIGALLATKFIASDVLTAHASSSTSLLTRFGNDNRAIWVLGLGTTAGYAIQLLVQLPAMRKAGFSFRPVWDPRHPAVRRVVRLSSWLIGVVVANQASLALVMILAGRTDGGVTAYQFSFQFFQLPYALVAVSVASAIMPDLAERWTARDTRGFQRQFVTGLRTTLAVLVPAGLVYVAIAQPFIQLAVHHGRVTSHGAHLVGSTLALFAAGLPGFSAFFLLMRAYQAMQEARAMFWIYALENAVTAVAAVALEPVLGVPGLALAWVAPYTVASFVAAADLRRRVGSFGGAHTVRAIVRITVAAAITGGVAVLLGMPFPSRAGDAMIVGRLIVQVGGSALVYLLLARLFGIRELRPVLRLLSRA